MSWGCKYLINAFCRKRNLVCEPGKKGCTLEGKVSFSKEIGGPSYNSSTSKVIIPKFPGLIIANTASIPLIQNLAHEIWNEYFRSLLSLAQIKYMLQMEYDKEILEKEISSSHIIYFIYYDPETDLAMGYLAIEVNSSKLSLKLSKIYLRQSYRKRGLGQKMLNYVSMLAAKNKLQEISLQVNINNELAIEAFKQNGFIVSNSLKEDIGNGLIREDLVFKKAFPYQPPFP